MEHEYYMREALKSAREAFAAGETPVGAVVVKDGEIIGRGRNRTQAEDATCHAEVLAIREASRRLGTWRLAGCTLYVTMEPCPMCTGAIMLSRLDTVVFGLRDPRMGSCGSVIDLFMERYGARAKVIGGILQEECGGLLREFYGKLREK